MLHNNYTVADYYLYRELTQIFDEGFIEGGRGDFSRANKKFKQVESRILKEYPNFKTIPSEFQILLTRAKLGIGYSLMEENCYHPAIKVFNEILDKDYNNLAAYAYRYRCFEAVGNIKSAKDSLETISVNFITQTLESIPNYLRELPQNIVESIPQAVKNVFIVDSWNWFGWAEICMISKEYKHARKAFEIAAHLDTKLEVAALNGRGRSYYNEYIHYDKDIKEYKHTSKIAVKRKSSSTSQLTLSPETPFDDYIYQAEKAYRDAINLNRTSATTFKNMGVLQDLKQDYKEALKYYHIALEHNPRFADVYRLMAITIKHTCLNENRKQINQNRDEVIQMLQQAVIHNAHDHVAIYETGVALSERGWFKQAIIMFRGVILRNPYYFKAYNALGNAYMSLNKFDEALELQERALELEPKNYIALNDKAWSLYRLGRYDKALVSADQATEIEPDTDNALDTMGCILRAQGKFEEALAYFKKSGEHTLTKVAYHCNMGSTLCALRRFNEAEDEFNSASELLDNQKDEDPNYLGFDNAQIMKSSIEIMQKLKSLIGRYKELKAKKDEQDSNRDRSKFPIEINSIEILLKELVQKLLNILDFRVPTYEQQIEQVSEQISQVNKQVEILERRNIIIEQKINEVTTKVEYAGQIIEILHHKLEPILQNVHDLKRIVD